MDNLDFVIFFGIIEFSSLLRKYVYWKFNKEIPESEDNNITTIIILIMMVYLLIK